MGRAYSIPPGRAGLEAILPAYIQPRRWFGGKARQITAAQIVEAIPLATAIDTAFLTMVRLAYAEGDDETYALPLAFASGADVAALRRQAPHAIVARIQHDAHDGVLFDALFQLAFCGALLDLIADNRRLEGASGELQASSTIAFQRLRGEAGTPLEPKIVTAEQSNSSIIYGDRFILKLFRRLDGGLNPDLEIGRFLTERGNFAHVPPVAGALEYQAAGEIFSLAILQGFVPNQGDAWGFTLTELSGYFQRVLASQLTPPDNIRLSTPTMLDLAQQELPREAQAQIGDYLARAQLLGRRTAELHLALASNTADSDFAPEPFTAADQRAIYESMRDRAVQSFRTLRWALGDGSLPASIRAEAEQVLNLEQQTFDHYRPLLERRFAAMRTRIHGDYHLGQVLFTGADFFIIDFEGEPARPLSERRRKGSPLQDVAGMLRSFHYAPYAVLFGQAPGVRFAPEQAAALEPWANLWHSWVGIAFLQTYLATAGAAPFLPGTRDELETLLNVFLLDKAIYELNYELNNRPAWVQIPVEGILQLLEV